MTGLFRLLESCVAARYRAGIDRPRSHMLTLEISSLLALGVFVWLWLDSLNARDAAVRASRAQCEAENLLFLDDTVAIRSIWPARSEDGRLKLRRVYDFEYSDTGNNRRRGSVTMIGNEVIALHLGLRFF